MDVQLPHVGHLQEVLTEKLVDACSVAYETSCGAEQSRGCPLSFEHLQIQQFMRTKGLCLLKPVKLLGAEPNMMTP